MATITIAQEQVMEEEEVLPIDPETGHRLTDDDVAIHRARGPDIGDPPPAERPFRRLTPQEEVEPFEFQEQACPLPDQGPPGGGGFPVGPPGGRGSPPVVGWPGGFGGPPGGGFPAPPPAAPAAPQQPHQTNKFVGNAPVIFTGDRTKTEEFSTQWELYWGVNNNNSIMSNAYR